MAKVQRDANFNRVDRCLLIKCYVLLLLIALDNCLTELVGVS